MDKQQALDFRPLTPQAIQELSILDQFAYVARHAQFIVWLMLDMKAQPADIRYFLDIVTMVQSRYNG